MSEFVKYWKISLLESWRLGISEFSSRLIRIKRFALDDTMIDWRVDLNRTLAVRLDDA